jgi:hypothetical protein
MDIAGFCKAFSRMYADESLGSGTYINFNARFIDSYSTGMECLS